MMPIIRLVLIAFSLAVLNTCSHLPPAVAQPVELSQTQPVGSTFMRITLLGTLEIPPLTVAGFPIHELSGLAWDADEARLYAVSDQGILFHFQPQFDPMQRLIGIEPLAAFQLESTHSDAEGLTVLHANNGQQGDTVLIVSFERVPLIAQFTPTGQWLQAMPLPPALTDANAYQAPNKMLESVAWHDSFGLLTAPERALTTTAAAQTVLYGTEQQWFWPTHPAPASSVVAIEPIDNSSILVLERAFQDASRPLVISLRQVWLSSCDCAEGVASALLQLAEFNNTEGWNIDNFEGLTHHEEQRFFMVSDDNGHLLQRTLLSYFAILPGV
jgi:hypothetical protein